MSFVVKLLFPLLWADTAVPEILASGSRGSPGRGPPVPGRRLCTFHLKSLPGVARFGLPWGRPHNFAEPKTLVPGLPRGLGPQVPGLGPQVPGSEVPS